MRSRLTVLACAVIALAVSACGSSKKTTTSKPATTSQTTSTATTPKKPAVEKKKKKTAATHTYRVRLTSAGTKPRGVAHAGGNAVVALHGTNQVCWRFSHLHGFTDPTRGEIYKKTNSPTGLPVLPLTAGSAFHHQGCVRAAPGLVTALAKNPKSYYVAVLARDYPHGAVRATL